MKDELAKSLDECIARIRKGETIEACLAEYPHLRQKLEALLHITLSLSAMPRVSPSDEFRRVSKARVMMRCREEQIKNEAVRSNREAPLSGGMENVWRWWQQNITGLRRVAVPVAVMLLLVLLASLSQFNEFKIMPPTPALASSGTLTILRGRVQVKS